MVDIWNGPGRTTLLIVEHPENADCSMLVTLSGIVIVVSPE